MKRSVTAHLTVAALAVTAAAPATAQAGWSHPRRLPDGGGVPDVAVAANGVAAVAYGSARAHRGVLVRLRPGRKPRHRTLTAPDGFFETNVGVSRAGRIVTALESRPAGHRHRTKLRGILWEPHGRLTASTVAGAYGGGGDVGDALAAISSGGTAVIAAQPIVHGGLVTSAAPRGRRFAHRQRLAPRYPILAELRFLRGQVPLLTWVAQDRRHVRVAYGDGRGRFGRPAGVLTTRSQVNDLDTATNSRGAQVVAWGTGNAQFGTITRLHAAVRRPGGHFGRGRVIARGTEKHIPVVAMQTAIATNGRAYVAWLDERSTLHAATRAPGSRRFRRLPTIAHKVGDFDFTVTPRGRAVMVFDDHVFIGDSALRSTVARPGRRFQRSRPLAPKGCNAPGLAGAGRHIVLAFECGPPTRRTQRMYFARYRP